MLPPILKSFWMRIWELALNVFTTRSTREFRRFTQAPIAGTPVNVEPAPAFVNVRPLRSAPPVSDPAVCEEKFTTAMRSGSFQAAWDLLTPDSQASWQRQEVFEREMETTQPRSIVGSKVREVRLLPSWTDESTRRTYHQVAELVVDYHIRQPTREMVVTKDVHLVNVSGGWKSLCYRT